MAEGDTLFQAIARNRREWTAQGLLHHAVLREPRVRSALLEAAGCADREDRPNVIEEVPTEPGWRADLRIAWSDQRLDLELKLGAPLTPRQEQAASVGAIHLVVAPASTVNRQKKLGQNAISWGTLAEKANNACLGELLRQVEADSSWWLTDIGQAEVEHDFEVFKSEGVRAATRLYKFLSTVDEVLRQNVRDRYKAARGWSCVHRGNWPYYGYSFLWGADGNGAKERNPLPVWVGFERSPDDTDVRFRLYPGSRKPTVLSCEHAESVADKVVEVLAAGRTHAG